jgi:hypothetical protein
VNEPNYRVLPRFYARSERAASEAKIARILLETGADVEPPKTVAKATLPGDSRRLRGVPLQCVRGATGAIAGTDPVQALLAAEHRSERGRGT